MAQSQLPNRPAYWSDRRVLLYEGQLSAYYGKRLVLYSGAISLEWQPRPQIVWHGSTDSDSDVSTVMDHWLRSDTSEATVDLTLGVAMPPATPRFGAVRVSRPIGVLSDRGPCDGLEFTPPASECDHVTFNLINGSDLLPLAPLKQRGRAWSGRWQLDDGEWTITLDSRPDLSQRIKALRDTRGYVFTHVGKLERGDRCTFTPSAARRVLDDLFLFLTLIRGATVGVALPVGALHGNVTWRLWTTGLGAPYTGAFSWADPHTPHDLETVWPLFRAARGDMRWSNALLRAVRHYAEANQAVSAEVTLTLAQAALELLGTAICVDRDEVAPFSKWDGRSADWRIRRLLRDRVPTELPTQFKPLAAAAKAHGWGDGPAALTALRNTVTHWTTGKPSVDALVWAQAAQLSLYYLEMAVLSSLGYSGRALDRTKQPLFVGGSAMVPWAK